MHINPYLFFEGRCEEAIEFYKATLGAKVEMLMRFGDMPDMKAPIPKEKIMHASLKIGDAQIMASDGMCSGNVAPQGYALSLTTPDVAEAERLFALLSEGGEVRQAMAKTFFAPIFGIVADKFGVSWMVLAAQEPH